MSDFIKQLTRKNTLRKSVRTLSVEDIEKVIADLSDILEERVQMESEARAALEEKKAKIQNIRSVMSEYSIGMDDLLGVPATSPKKTIAPRYRIVDENGEEVLWTGRGRTPKVFAEQLAKGANKEDFLI